MGKDNTQLSFGFTIEELEAAYYLSMNVPPKNITQITGVPQERVKELLKDDRFKSEIANARISIATKQQAIRSAIHDLAQEKLLNILSQDYASASESERREIARTARFASVIEEPERNATSNITNNLVVVEDGMKVLAKHIARLQGGYSDPEEIEHDYSISRVAATYSCAPGTTRGMHNYDSESGDYQCHICGKWYYDFEEHVQEHGISMDEYREIFEIDG